MYRAAWFLFAAWMAVLVTFRPAWSDTASEASPAMTWHTDYATAWDEAVAARKMLLINFQAEQPSDTQRQVDQAIETDTELQGQLGHFVLARLPLTASVKVGGEETRLLDHPAFAEMHGKEGFTIIDLMHQSDDEYYQQVVSAFPFMHGKYYQFEPAHLKVILDLPPGTLTQRTMIWAVRVHPERPKSTAGESNKTLLREARRHSNYQARIGQQGHHMWSDRFERIRSLLNRPAMPVEVVAESWPGQTMIDSCIDCVASWRQSSGHWNAVNGYHTLYAYDIKKSNNGVWYGTGIFASDGGGFVSPQPAGNM